MPSLETCQPKETLLNQHLLQIFHACRFVQALPPADLQMLKAKSINLPRPASALGKKKTVVFDLDETLVHSHCEGSGDAYLKLHTAAGMPVKVAVNLRPYVHECLVEINKYFEPQLEQFENVYKAIWAGHFSNQIGDLVKRCKEGFLGGQEPSEIEQ